MLAQDSNNTAPGADWHGWHDWDVVHVITTLELGGAQRATLAQLHGPWTFGARTLLHGPVGGLDPNLPLASQAGPVTPVQAECIPALRPPISLSDDAQALGQLSRALFKARQRAHRAGRRLLVHTHSSKAGILARLAAYAVGAERIVHSVHGFGHSQGKRFHERTTVQRGLLAAERVASRVTDGFATDSAANLRQGRLEGIIRPRHAAQVVYCGVQVDAYAPRTDPAWQAQVSQLRDQLLGNADRAQGRVVLCVACLKPQKDPVAFVRLAAQLAPSFPYARFVVAGDGPLRSRVETEIERQQLGSRVRLLGWRTDMPVLLAASDLLVSTSLWEGLPQTFAQAMAAGLPIVTTHVDGAAEAVEHGRTGYLVRRGAVDDMRTRVAALLSDEELARRMGRTGQASVDRFSSTAVQQALGSLYRRVLQA